MPRRLLLDCDASLGEGMGPDMIEVAARAFSGPVVHWDKGAAHIADLERHPSLRGPLRGLLVIEGALVSVLSSGRFNAGRVVCRDEIELLSSRSEIAGLAIGCTWAALTSSKVLLLDEALMSAIGGYPLFAAAVLRRATLQTEWAHAQLLICQNPRVQDRLLALFELLAHRVGTVDSAGTHIRLNLAHRVLSDMIAATRPTVSLAISKLAAENKLLRTSTGWMLPRPALVRG